MQNQQMIGRLGWSGGCVVPARVEITVRLDSEQSGDVSIVWTNVGPYAEGNTTLGAEDIVWLNTQLETLRSPLESAHVMLPISSSLTSCWVDIPWLSPPLKAAYADGQPGPPLAPILQKIDALVLALQTLSTFQIQTYVETPKRISVGRRWLRRLLGWSTPVLLYIAWVLFWGVTGTGLQQCGVW